MTNSSELSTAQFPKLFFVLCLVLFVLALGFFGVYTSQASDPYIQNVLARQGDAVRGNAIFQINCAGCHGISGDGNVGPSLHGVAQRKSNHRLIQQVVSGKTPPMPKFQPVAQDMADLLSYLHTL